MKDHTSVSSVNCLGMLILLLSLTHCELCVAFVRNWEPVGLSGGGGMFSPAISPAAPNLMMLNCDMSAACISEDGGHNWRMIHQVQLRTDTQCRPGFHPSDPNVICGSSQGRLKISRDRGRTFTPIGELKDSLSSKIAINPSASSMVLVGTRNGQCRLSHDAGVTWAACPGPQGRVIGFHFDRADNGRTMCGATDRSIWRSDDDGQIWVKSTDGLPWKEIERFDGYHALLHCDQQAGKRRQAERRCGRDRYAH